LKSLNIQKPWRVTKNWKYPYSGLNDPNYIKDRNELFRENGNGWWWGMDSDLKPIIKKRS